MRRCVRPPPRPPRFYRNGPSASIIARTFIKRSGPSPPASRESSLRIFSTSSRWSFGSSSIQPGGNHASLPKILASSPCKLPAGRRRRS